MTDNAKKIYDKTSADAVLVSQEDLRLYLTGFSSSFGYVLTDGEGSVFYTDQRYLEGAHAALGGTGIAVKQFRSLEEIVKPYKKVAVHFGKTLYPEYNRLKSLGLELVDSSDAFTQSMSVKEDYEILYIKKACEITDRAYCSLLKVIKEGMSENEAAAELEYLMRKYGASGTSFDTIVAFGGGSSVPHHETGSRTLKFGDIVLIDFGCKVSGYCSDCTRTFLFGDDGRHGDFKKAYGRVLEAHMLVKQNLAAGMTGREADAIARDCLKNYGLDGKFTHSLGHGIGVNIHEFPRLSAKSDDILVENMVFSDEPGVYFEGEYGIRIEDTVTLKDGKVISLTDSDKKLTVI